MLDNLPTLFKQLERLPWAQIPVGHRTRDRGHGRRETRTVKAVTVHTPGGIAFPHAQQAIRITRTRIVAGKTSGNWLFFGGQRQATDFYYADELAALRTDGVLTRLDLAFSRGQRTKVYVQDRMREHGAQLWKGLQDGAHLYVCGDASRMARDVDNARRDIATTHGRLDPDAADAYLKQLSSDKR